MRAWITLSVVCAVGCGGAGAASPRERAPVQATSGDDAPQAAPAPAPVVLRTTVPIPVPQPAIARERLSAPLQHVWDLVEAAVAVRPPEPPTEATQEAITAWASGPFHEWVGRRAEAVHAVEEAEAPMHGARGAERGVAAALFGFLYEETAAAARGAPVPRDLAADPELLHAYDQALLESLTHYARASVISYSACVRAFTELHDVAWSEWGPYCLDHAREVAQVYRLFPSAPPPPPPTTGSAPPA